mgnify:CR=1 FL=1
MGLMIDQGLIPKLLKLIRMGKYNPSALWTLDNVLYNNETDVARGKAVKIAWTGGAIKTLADILCARYSPSRGGFVSTDGTSCEIVNAAIHCLRIMVVNDESSRKEMVKLPGVEGILTSMSQIEINGDDQIQNAIYEDIKNVARDIIRKLRKVPAAEIIKDMRQKLPQLVQRIRENTTDADKLWTLDNVLYDDKADEVRMDAVNIAQKKGVVEILIENLRAGYSPKGSIQPFTRVWWNVGALYFPKIPYKYRLEPFTSATIHCLRIMVLNNPDSRTEMVKSENMRDIIESLADHLEADEYIKGAAAHILKEVEEFQNTSSASILGCWPFT